MPKTKEIPLHLSCDGNYTYHADKHIQETQSKEIDFVNLIAYVVSFIEEKFPGVTPVYNKQCSYIFMGMPPEGFDQVENSLHAVHLKQASRWLACL